LLCLINVKEKKDSDALTGITFLWDRLVQLKVAFRSGWRGRHLFYHLFSCVVCWSGSDGARKDPWFGKTLKTTGSVQF
jgi:hypothetical protein